jgi:putative tricarboxylic transport membrane protein
VRIHSDQAAAAVIIAVAAAAYGYTFTFPEVPKALQQGMGPERYPQLVSLVLIGLGVLLAIKARGRADDTRPPPLEPAVVLTAASGALFIGAVWLVGMPAAMVLALVALGLLWGERRWLPLLLNAVLLPAIIWAVFVRGLKVPLPTGVLGQLLGV